MNAKAPAVLKSLDSRFFGIRLGSVVPGVPLPFDIFLLVNDRPILFRRAGDSISGDRLKSLAQFGSHEFLVPEDQRNLYVKSLSNIIQDPDTNTETKSTFIKETAYLHINDLFTKEDISQVVVDAKNLVHEMVRFVSTDVDAVASLMRLSVHDYYTYNHCVDVSVYSIVLAKKIFGEDKNLLMLAGLGGLLHDIGKKKIDWALINKSTPLTAVEWEEIRRHPSYGWDTLVDIAAVPEDARQVVFQHHESFDGTGYPKGLKDEEISKVARVVTIADVFDALTTDRSYSKAVTPAQALNTMYGMQPGKFDPNIFRSFNKNFTVKKPDIQLPKDFDPCSPMPIKNQIKVLQGKK